MDDLENIIYVILIVIYIASRLFRKAKPRQPTPEMVQPPVEKKPESLFDTIREEIKRQQELAKAQQEAKEKPPVQQKKPSKPARKKTVQPEPALVEGELTLDTVEGEGVSSLDKKIKTALLIEEKEESPALEFDPREAFRIKTLLERHPFI